VLCDEHTGSGGEAFTEGFKRLGLGKVIGTRTWGGEIWLSFDNRLVGKGIASAAEYGVYGPEGKWLIEGHGVDPDVVVDNRPQATFEGEDSQLTKAIDYLQEQIRQKPITVFLGVQDRTTRNSDLIWLSRASRLDWHSKTSCHKICPAWASYSPSPIRGRLTSGWAGNSSGRHRAAPARLLPVET
jgi:C-terminal processing protease CtpA/Prc